MVLGGSALQKGGEKKMWNSQGTNRTVKRRDGEECQGLLKGKSFGANGTTEEPERYRTEKVRGLVRRLYRTS